MLTVMSNATSVGYYSNSTKIVKAAANTLTGISAVLMPRFSYLFSEDNKSEIKKLSRQFLNVTFFNICTVLLWNNIGRRPNCGSAFWRLSFCRLLVRLEFYQFLLY